MNRLFTFTVFSTWLAIAQPLAAQTNISIGTTALQTGVKRLGINLDGHNFYDSKQILKNLVMRNPGFSPTLYHAMVGCASGSASTCVDNNPYSGWNGGFWIPYVAYVQVISGTCAGLSTVISNYTGPTGGVGGTYTFNTPCTTGAIANGDYMIIGQTIGGASNTVTTMGNWWPTTTGNGSITIETSDVPPAPSTSVQAATLTAPTSNDVASLSQYFDSTAGHSFVTLNGTFQIQFAAKALSGSKTVNVSFSRGGTYYLASTPITLTTSWANYTQNFTATETGSQSGQCQLQFATAGADSFELDNVALVQLGTSSSNPTVFRDAVVTTLQTLKPGVIRMWDGVGLGNTLDNMLVDQFGRSPVNYSAYAQASPNQYAYNDSSYSLPDFLQLVQTVGNSAEAWVVLPITMTTAEASNLIDYLSGGSSTTYGAKRIAQGFTTPWSTVIPKIHLEFGNEAWNSTFDGGNLKSSSVYGARADAIFAAMKANPNYVAGSMDLVLGGFFANAGYLQDSQNHCTHNDSVDMAPYMMNSPTDASSTQAIWGPALTEPQAYYAAGTGVAAEGIGSATASSGYFIVGGTAGTQNGGGAYLNLLAEANSSNPKPVTVYEENFSTTQGSYTQAQLNAYTSAWGAGLATVEEELIGIQKGVLTQNLFSLSQYHFGTQINGETAFLWGSVVDMGGATNLRRPQFLAEQVANMAIAPGATMLQTTQTGTPAYTQSLLNTVAMTNSNLVQSFAFSNGSGNFGVVLLNTGVTGSQAVTFSGTNAPPSGATVTQTVLTSANLSDTNETSSVVAPVTTTLTNFNPTTGITLAPYSETVLTWSTAAVVPTTYYVSNTGSDSNNGTSATTPWLTVAKVNATTLTAGSSVLFQAGGLWRETLTMSQSGTSGSPLTIGSYGTGAAPIIDGANLATWTNVSGNIWRTAATTNPLMPNFSGVPGVQETTQAAVTAANEWYWDGSAYLYVYSTTNPATIVEIPARAFALNLNGQSYITVTGIEARGAQNYGIVAQAATGFSNLTISNNTIDLNYSNGMNVLTTAAGAYATAAKFTGNTFKNNGSSGLKVGGYWNTFTITNNTANYNCLYPSASTSFDNVFCGGIYVFSVSGTDGSGTVISGNQANYNGLASQADLSYGQGIWTDTTTGVTVSGNTAHDNESNGIYLEKTVNGVAYENLSYNNATQTYSGDCVLAAGQTHNSTNNLFLENTCGGGGYTALQLNFEDSNGTMSGNVIQDNIFFNTTSLAFLASAQVNDGTHGSGNVLNYNSFGTAYTNQFYTASSFYSTYSSFETAWCGSAGCTNSLQLDPQFVSPSTRNYNLQATSPARAFGVPNSNYPPVCGGTKVDLGALPYACTVVITPAAPAVAAGASVTLTASQSVTWSLAGSGSLSTTTGTSTVYTAPTGIVPQHQMLGCPVMPNDSIFNTRIDALPLDSRSPTWTTGAGSASFTFQSSWGISYADSSTPTRALRSYYGGYSNTFPWPTGIDMKREGGNYIGETNLFAPDHHVMTVKRDDCTFYDAYDDKLNGATLTCQDGVTTTCNLSSAISYKWSNYQVQPAGGTDAAGMPLAPLTVHLSEWKAGVINHAMRYTTALGYVQGNSGTGTPYLWPAVTSNGCPTSTCPNAPIIGARARLKSNFNISTFSPAAQVFLLALQRYGVILSDIGTSNAITAGSDLWSDPTALAALNEIGAARITMSSFEFVDETSLEVNPSSYQACPLNQTCAGVQNTFEAPVNSAVITATASSGAATSTPIAIQAVSIGSKIGPDVVVMAGSYSWTIATWVNGSSNQTVNWTLTSGVGSVTAGGVYTPPATTVGGTSAVLHGVAAADSAAVINLYLTIVPAGTLRIDTGASANTTDTLGNIWLGNIQPEGLSVLQNDTYPGWITNSPYILQYETGVYSYANDLAYSSIIVPNGNYDVSYLIGLNNQCGSVQACGSFPVNGQVSIYSYAPVHLESQGQIGMFTYDPFLTVGYRSAVPTPVVSIPAKVTNNVLYAAIRGVSNDIPPYYGTPNLQKTTILQGLVIGSDTSTPHWTIYTQQQSTIASGQTLLPFRVVDWFTGVNDPTWSVSGKGASITTTTDQYGTIVGTLTLASGTYLSGQPIVVTASDGTYSASTTIYTQASSYAINPLPKVNHYSYKRAITINHALVSSADQANFPVLLNITDPTLATSANGGHVLSSNGYDLILTSDSACSTKLNWETNKYDPVAGTWIVWFKQPVLSHSTNTTVYVCYGNPAIVTQQSPSTTAVWNSNYLGVYHLESLTADSTANANSLTNPNASFITQTSGGLIGGAAHLSSTYSLSAPAAVLSGANKGTISMWVNTSGPANSTPYRFGWEQDSNFLDFFNNQNPLQVGWEIGSTDHRFNTSTASISTSAWHYLAYTWDQTVPAQFAYIDGVQVGTSTTAFTITTPTGVFDIGGLPNYNMLGNVDETHFSNIALTAGWLATEYANQSSPGTFYTVGGETAN